MPPKKTTKKADADYTYESNSDYSDGGSDDDVEEEEEQHGGATCSSGCIT